MTALLFSQQLDGLSAESYTALLTSAKITPPLKLSQNLRQIVQVLSKVNNKVMNTRIDGSSRIIKSIYLGQNTVNVETTIRAPQSQSESLEIEKLLFFQVGNQVYLRLESIPRALELPIQWVGKVTLNNGDEAFSWAISTTMPFEFNEFCSVSVLGNSKCQEP